MLRANIRRISIAVCFVFAAALIVIYANHQQASDKTTFTKTSKVADVAIVKSFELSVKEDQQNANGVDSTNLHALETLDLLGEEDAEGLELPELYIPLKEIEPTKEESHALYGAEEKLVENCMKERGFDYIQNSVDDNSTLDQQPETVRAGDIAAAKQRGYGLADSVVNSDWANTLSPQSPNDEYVKNLSQEQQQEWKTALFGDISAEQVVSVEDPVNGGAIGWDSNSCFAIARGQLFESNVKHAEDRFANFALQEQVYSTADEDVEYQAALGQWQNCMAEHELHFERPGEAADQLVVMFRNGEISLEELRAREIELASIDSTCYHSASIDQARNSALQRSEAMLMHNNSEAIAELRQSIENAVERALIYTR